MEKDLNQIITSGKGTTICYGSKIYVTPNKLSDKGRDRIIKFMEEEGIVTMRIAEAKLPEGYENIDFSDKNFTIIGKERDLGFSPKDRPSKVMVVEPELPTTFMGDEIPVSETWPDKSRDFKEAILFSEPFKDVESKFPTAYVFTPGPNDKHLHGYFCGKIKEEWETVVLGETFWARYNRRLTYEEVKQIIVDQKDTDEMIDYINFSHYDK